MVSGLSPSERMQNGMMRSPACLPDGSDALVISRQVLEHVRQQVCGQAVPGAAQLLHFPVHSVWLLSCVLQIGQRLPSGVIMGTANFLLFRLILKLGGMVPAWRLCQQ